VRAKIAKSSYSVIICIPKVQTGLKSHWEYISWWPFQKIQVEVILQVGRIQNLKWSFGNFPNIII